jgi:hypothetical protein
MIFLLNKPENREKAFRWLFAAAQLSLFVSLLLQRMPGDPLPFLAGILEGFSLVGNLASIIYFSRKMKSNRDGGNQNA